MGDILKEVQLGAEIEALLPGAMVIIVSPETGRVFVVPQAKLETPAKFTEVMKPREFLQTVAGRMNP